MNTVIKKDTCPNNAFLNEILLDLKNSKEKILKISISGDDDINNRDVALRLFDNAEKQLEELFNNIRIYEDTILCTMYDNIVVTILKERFNNKKWYNLDSVIDLFKTFSEIGLFTNIEYLCDAIKSSHFIKYPDTYCDEYVLNRFIKLLSIQHYAPNILDIWYCLIMNNSLGINNPEIEKEYKKWLKDVYLNENY